jgi:predicted kinase
MQRILVIGSPGSGKSTRERHLANRLGLPLVYPQDVRPETVGMLECERLRRRVFVLRSRAEMSRVEDELAPCVKAA